MTEELKNKKSPFLKNISSNLGLPLITGLLLLIVVFQSFQLQQLKGYAKGLLEGREVKAASVAENQTPTATVQKKSINTGLPSQVGGC